MKCKFELFDPKQGPLPAKLSLLFFDVLHRSRTLLSRRTTDDIRAGAEVLSAIPSHPNYRHLDYDILDTKPSAVVYPDGETARAWPAPDDVTRLTHNVERIKLADYPQFKKGQWYELFAILALSFIESAIREDRRRHENTPAWMGTISDESIDRYVAELASQASQAVAAADALYTQTKLKSIGGQKRHAADDPLKSVVTKLAAAKYSQRSAREAAKRVFAELEASGRVTYDLNSKKLNFDGIHVATNDDPAERFAKWIGKHRSSSKLAS